MPSGLLLFSCVATSIIEENDKTFVFEIEEGVTFKLYNGRIFKKGTKRRKRYECLEISSGKLYLFNPNAEVELLE